MFAIVVDGRTPFAIVILNHQSVSAWPGTSFPIFHYDMSNTIVGVTFLFSYSLRSSSFTSSERRGILPSRSSCARKPLRLFPAGIEYSPPRRGGVDAPQIKMGPFRNGAGGVVVSAKLFRPEVFAELTTLTASRYRARASRPPAAIWVASQPSIDAAATPPRRGGE